MTGSPRAFAPMFLDMIRRGDFAPRYTIFTDARRPGLGEVVIWRNGLEVYAWRLRPHAPTDQPGYVHGEPIEVILQPVVVGSEVER